MHLYFKYYYTICCARVGDDPTILEDKKEPLKEIKLEEDNSIYLKSFSE